MVCLDWLTPMLKTPYPSCQTDLSNRSFTFINEISADIGLAYWLPAFYDGFSIVPPGLNVLGFWVPTVKTVGYYRPSFQDGLVHPLDEGKFGFDHVSSSFSIHSE